MNLGAILRSAFFFRVDRVVATARSRCVCVCVRERERESYAAPGRSLLIVPPSSFCYSCPLSPVVSRASAGALEMTPVYSVSNMAGFLQEAASCGWEVLGSVSSQHQARAQEVVSCYDYTPRGPTILVLGG